MDAVVEFFSSLDMNFDTFWKAALILLLGTILLGVFGRFVFGKRSALNSAVSSVIGILFIYGVTIVLNSFGAQFQYLIAPLPFVNISGDQLVLFSFAGAHFTAICAEVLSMIILAFLVNLADGFMPRGKNILTWLLFRCLTVAIGYILHLVAVTLLAANLPNVLVLYAPVILLGLLILLLLTGALKILVGALLTTVNPIIGGLYTFFFANIIGKQLTKAVLTTAILCAIVFGLQYFGIAAFSIAAGTLVAYIPFVIILVVLWFIVYKIL